VLGVGCASLFILSPECLSFTPSFLLHLNPQAQRVLFHCLFLVPHTLNFTSQIVLLNSLPLSLSLVLDFTLLPFYKAYQHQRPLLVIFRRPIEIRYEPFVYLHVHPKSITVRPQSARMRRNKFTFTHMPTNNSTNGKHSSVEVGSQQTRERGKPDIPVQSYLQTDQNQNEKPRINQLSNQSKGFDSISAHTTT